MVFTRITKSFPFYQTGLKLLLTVGALLVLFFSFITLSTNGLKLTLSLLTDFSPLQIRYEQLEGNLLTGAHFKTLSVKTPTFKIKAQSLSFSVQWNTFFQKNTLLPFLRAPKRSFSLLFAADPLQTLFVDSPIQSLQCTNVSLQWPHLTLSHNIQQLIYEKQKQSLFYEGSFGTLHTVPQAKAIQWDLTLPPVGILATYFSSPIKTQGHLLIPTASLANKQNTLELHCTAAEAQFANQRLREAQLFITGTATQHSISIKGKKDQLPFEMQLTGTVKNKLWEGVINTLKLPLPPFEKMGNTTGNLFLDWKNQAKLKGNALFTLWERYPLSIDFFAYTKKQLSLQGNLQSQIKDLRSLAQAFPEIPKIKGTLNLDLSFSGPLSHLEWQGKIALQDALLRMPTFSSQATLQQLNLQLLKHEHFTLSGTGTCGKGHFSIEGKGKTLPAPTLQLHLTGNDLLISDSYEYHIIATPDLHLSIENGKSHLEGRIFIPTAEIKSLRNPNRSAQSEDVIIVSSQVPKPQSALIPPPLKHTSSHLEIVLGDDIAYKTPSFSSKVQGSLSIKQPSGQPPMANGKLTLEKGKYRAYGKKFDIPHGVILFTGGPLVDPILDIRAQRKINTIADFNHSAINEPIVAGIQISGHVKTPKITFYSQPSMPDTDIIAYLVVGQPQSKINQAQAPLLFEAASQLTRIMGTRRKDVQFNLAEQLKLDQIGLAKRSSSVISDRNPLEDTVFILGKQLSDKLYLHYSVGLLDSVNNVGLRYFIGKNVMLEASTGTQNSSADVLFSFEGR